MFHYADTKQYLLSWFENLPAKKAERLCNININGLPQNEKRQKTVNSLQIVELKPGFSIH